MLYSIFYYIFDRIYFINMIFLMKNEFEMGYVAELIIWLAGHSQLLAHQLLWNMQANLYRDEESKEKDVDLFDPLSELITKVSFFVF